MSRHITAKSKLLDTLKVYSLTASYTVYLIFTPMCNVQEVTLNMKINLIFHVLYEVTNAVEYIGTEFERQSNLHVKLLASLS